MYESFYGLKDKPFQLNPDPSFYFGSSQHRRAMSYLEYGLHQNEGFIVITGEIGAGKTTLVRSLFEKLDPKRVVAAHMVTTQLDAADTLRMVAAAFGLPAKNMAKSELLLTLEAFFVEKASQGKRCLLVIDEAQNLSQGAVEELRMLSNFQLETHALLQSFLIGQPEFRHTLLGPAMEQLRQRVIASAHIGAMGLEETRAYIDHRLTHVGWTGSPRFDLEAYRLIYENTAGIPRRINATCDRLLWHGYLANRREFTAADVKEVATEMREEARAGMAAVDPAGPDAGERPRLRSIPTTVEAPSVSTAEPSISAQLAQIERDLRKFEASLLRMEQVHLENIKLVRRLSAFLGQLDDTSQAEGVSK
jgi:putative secretion ATPase (PEP-CTERM system associated)